MERILRNPLVWATAGLLLALSVVPKTSWVVKNHIDYLRGWYGASAIGPNDTTAWPRHIVDPRNWDQTLPNGVAFRRAMPFETKVEDLRRALQEFDVEPKKVALACILRNSSLPLHPKTKEIDTSAVRLLLAEVAREGQRLDPQNAFFPLMEWAYLSGLREVDAKRALLHASRLPEFTEYGFAESDMRIALMEGTFGYRGQLPRIALVGGSLYGHFSAIGSASDYLGKRGGDREERAAAARVFRLLMARSEAPVGMMVAPGVLARMLGLGPTVKLGDQGWRNRYLAATAAIDRQIEGPPITPLVQDALKELERTSQPLDALESLAAPRTQVGAGLLVALIAACLGLTLVGLLSSRLVDSRALTHFALWLGIPALLAASQEIIGPLVILPIPIVAFLLGRWRPWAGQLVGAVGSALVAAGVLGLLGEPRPSAWLLLALLAWLFAQTKLALKPGGAGLVLAVGFGALGVSFAAAGKADAGTSTAFAVALFGLAAAVSPARLRPERCLPPILAGISVLYVASVIWEVRADTQLGAVYEGFRREADTRREAMGLPPIMGRGQVPGKVDLLRSPDTAARIPPARVSP